MKTYHDKTFRDLTTFKIGGPIENLYYPETPRETKDLLSTGRQFHVVGAGSKVLAGPGPFERVICTKLLCDIHFDGDAVRIGAGAYAPNIAKTCVKRGLSGLEFLIDIPATIGGAVVMNAGFMGQDMSQVCVSVEYVTSEGEIKETSDIQWARRWCSLQGAGIVIAATFQLSPMSVDELMWRLDEYRRIRDERQPQGVASAGGIFINHWVLPGVLETLPYLRCGDAEIVANCPNFIVNHGAATFEQVLHLINLIECHAEAIGLSMQREIKIILK